MKKCNKCNETKEYSEFYKAKSNLDGYRGSCKQCCSNYNKEWQAKNPEKARAAWRTAEKKSRNLHRDRARRYGLTQEELTKLIDDANGVCTLCGRLPNKYLVVDHCHASGEVRNILCEPCNQALGLFQDNVEFLKKAIKYLEKHAPKALR